MRKKVQVQKRVMRPTPAAVPGLRGGSGPMSVGSTAGPKPSTIGGSRRAGRVHTNGRSKKY